MKKFIAMVLTAIVLVTAVAAFAEEKAETKKPAFRQKIAMTKEEKAEKKAKMQERAKEMLAKQLEEGKITQEEYDEKLAEIESGEFEFGKVMRRGRGFGRPQMKNDNPDRYSKRPERKELTEEEEAEKKAKMQERAKEMLAKQLEEGKITQEEYDEKLSKIESGEFEFGKGHGGMRRSRGWKHGSKKHGVPSEKSKTVSE